RLLSLRTHLFDRIVELTRMPAEALKTRYHGNLHLGKVLLAADDFLIFGFEGDTWLALEARRRKDSPLRDLASLLNSLDYARFAALEHAIVTRTEQGERFEQALGEQLAPASEALIAGYK